MELKEGIFKSPTFYKWFYIIFGRAITCPLAFATGGVSFQFGIESDPLDYVLLANSAFSFFIVYLIWVQNLSIKLKQIVTLKL